ncbi:type IX secretion system membrane protein PorP/SprF [Fulvivirga sp. RKSG066]|uniref:PorP/SprF family type IX secretion system membrane protein n=1 Tax=Fulvivirga aurantia TaxID=2529383 RepID=UPI0012BC6343|nr:type IX secretion system membrane protein PorP/SprF [Fulvivirga aurantia]MTI21099.1 type IX secretion system membrane protein PorP/SprF [Fulvivirga aurantia]
MKAKYLYLALIVFLLKTSTGYAQQDPLYNLYAFNQFMINPAYAGIYNNFNANLITRKQWAGIDGSPLTNMLSMHSSIADKFGGGILLINDRLGVNNNTEAQLAFSYKLFSGAKTLAFGVQGGLINYSYDYGKLNLAYVDDEGLDMNNEQFSKANFGTGIFYMTDKFYLGLSVPRILSVKVEDGVSSSTRYKQHYYLSSGAIIKFRSVSEVLLKPSFLVRYTANGQISADISFSALFVNTLWVGATLRNLSGIGIITQLQVSDAFRFGYSFELPTNQLVKDNFGTHELSLILELNLFKNQYEIDRYF